MPNKLLRLFPGSELLEEPKTWAPVVPADMLVPPPPITNGMAACSSCNRSFALGALAITAQGYCCNDCARAATVVSGPAVIGDIENMRIGRGRGWIVAVVGVAVVAALVAFSQL